MIDALALERGITRNYVLRMPANWATRRFAARDLHRRADGRLLSTLSGIPHPRCQRAASRQNAEIGDASGCQLDCRDGDRPRKWHEIHRMSLDDLIEWSLTEKGKAALLAALKKQSCWLYHDSWSHVARNRETAL